MPGSIERFNGQHIISLTANLHGITLGEAAQKLEKALAGSGAPPRGAKIVHEGRNSAATETISGLRIGLLLAVVAIFLLTGGEFPVAAAGAGDCSYCARGAVRRFADAASSPTPR